MPDPTPHFPSVFALLREEIGLDPASIGLSNVALVIWERMVACGLSEEEDYLQKLHSDENELRILKEHMVVHETWFFRDQAPFEFLSRHAAILKAETKDPSPLRLLSLPCSTGEEAYSLAITLLNSGWKPEHFSIDAVDLSQSAISKARAGRFSPHSFRGMDEFFRLRWFETVGEGEFLIDQSLSSHIRFFSDNLIAPSLLLGSQIYEVIFCRNLLIYLDDEALEKAFRALRRLLKPEGILVVGHAEAALVGSQGFVRLKEKGAFAFRKARQVEKAPSTATSATLPRSSSPRETPSPKSSSFPPTSPPLSPSKPEKHEPFQISMESARSLADAGHYTDASVILENILIQHPSDASAWQLRGVIALAKSQMPDAEVFLRKAVYLDPKNPEMLSHLAMVLDAVGRSDEARRLRERARREQKSQIATVTQ